MICQGIITLISDVDSEDIKCLFISVGNAANLLI